MSHLKLICGIIVSMLRSSFCYILLVVKYIVQRFNPKSRINFLLMTASIVNLDDKRLLCLFTVKESKSLNILFIVRNKSTFILDIVYDF